MLIYIAGPITGKENDNRDAFELDRGVVALFYQEAKIVIPHDLYTPDRAARICPTLCWTEAMAECLPVAESADLVVALSGWQKSRGARREIEKAKAWIECTELGR